jgi:hypothetical protein
VRALAAIASAYRIQSKTIFQLRAQIPHNRPRKRRGGRPGRTKKVKLSDVTQTKWRTKMKNVILATLVAVSAVATGAVAANAGSFAVHGYTTHYGR